MTDSWAADKESQKAEKLARIHRFKDLYPLTIIRVFGLASDITAAADGMTIY